MPKAPPLTIVEETKVVALLARGDRIQDIIDAFPGRQYKMSNKTVMAVRKRNAESLALLKQQALEKATEDAGSIKEKANKKISRRLDSDEKNRQVLEKAKSDMLDDKITWKEYKEILRAHKDLSIQELVSVSKEMHSQSSKATDDETPKADLAALVAAIKSGEETKITQVLFNARTETPIQEHLPPIQTS